MKVTIHTVTWVIGFAVGAFVNYFMFMNIPMFKDMYPTTPDIVAFVIGGGFPAAFMFYGFSKWLSVVYNGIMSPFRRMWKDYQTRRVTREFDKLKAMRDETPRPRTPEEQAMIEEKVKSIISARR